MRLPTFVLLSAAVSGCVAEVDIQAPGLNDDFAAAAKRYRAPTDLLAAISYVETRWQMVTGDGQEGSSPGVGLFALSGDNLTLGAAAAGIDERAVSSNVDASIAAAAARLASLARADGVAGDDLAVWTPVIADFAQSDDDDVRAGYVHDVLRVLATGAREVGEDGIVIASIDPHPELAVPPAHSYNTAPVDHDGAVWRASPNYNSRNGYGISLVVIHDCEGSYASCWGELRRTGSQVSAHYVVNADGSEVTQLVRESNRAWHVAASYDCSRAGDQQCDLDGVSTNNFSIGIEHAGFASNTSWDPGLLDTSAKLTCDVTRRYGIPRDRDHIVAHGQLQPWNRTDPGPNWPWSDYIDRVRAACGDDGGGGTGSDPIIVDSNQANNTPGRSRIELTGTWTSSAATPGYYGTGYWVAQTAPTTAPASFWFYLPSAATRTIDGWWTTGSDRSSAAVFIGFDADGNEVGRTTVDQQADGSQWVPLGTWSFTAGWNKVVLSRWAPTGKVVVADAVRIR